MTALASTAIDAQLPTALTMAVAAPCAERQLWALLVRCPYCSHSSSLSSLHLHRAASPHGVVRRSGCDKGSYLILTAPGMWA